jgi:HAD superfamily hydrolase (TIGR01490 family)
MRNLGRVKASGLKNRESFDAGRNFLRLSFIEYSSETLKGKGLVHLIVFDLDHTLLTVNSSFRFGFYLYRQKIFSFWTLLLLLSDYARHKWGSMSVQALHARSFARLFKGQNLSEVRQHVDKFLTEALPSMLYAPVVERLRAAQKQGDEVVILSSSPDFLVGEIARRLHVQRWKATMYEVNKEGKFMAISHVMEGHDKAQYVKTLADQMHLPFSNMTVYSDSYLDLPVLKIAGRAIGVVPDCHLKRICLQNGWEIL